MENIPQTINNADLNIKSVKENKEAVLSSIENWKQLLRTATLEAQDAKELFNNLKDKISLLKDDDEVKDVVDSLNNLLQNNAFKNVVRELSPEENWSAKFDNVVDSLEPFNGWDEKQIPEAQLLLYKALKQAATKTDFTYSGAISSDGSYTYTRYPRKEFGPVASVDTHQNAMNILGTLLDNKATLEDTKSTQRVLMGLQEGYMSEGKCVDKINNSSTIINDLKEMGCEAQVITSQIMSVGPWGYYAEPAVIITSNEPNFKEIMVHLADKYHQSRINFEGNDGQANLIETRWCNDPDKK